MSLPTENRWPWIPWPSETFQQARKNEDHQTCNPWSSSWNPWSTMPFERNQNQQNSGLFSTSEGFSSAAGCLGGVQPISEDFLTDQSMIFQNIINENRLKNSKLFCPPSDFPSRKKSLKNRKKYRRMKQIANDATVNSSHGLQEQQRSQRWNHVPVFDWSQNLPPKSLNTNFQNSLRSGTSNERCKNSRRRRYLTRVFTNTSINVLSPISEIASCTNLKSQNLSNNFAESLSTGNIVSHNAPTLNGSNRPAIKEKEINTKKKTQLKPPSSTNLENNEEDIIYLFSVDSSSEEKVILEIDLESDGVHLIPNRNSKEAVNLTQKSKTDGAEDLPIVILGESDSSIPVTSRKRKLLSDDNKKNKRSNYMPRCTACDLCYDAAIGKSGNMYISSSCTHVFCSFCVSEDRNLKVCPACNIEFLSFRRLYM